MSIYFFKRRQINFSLYYLSVCELWKLAASSTCRKVDVFSYVQIRPSTLNKLTAERLNFVQFVNIFKLVSPHLKKAKIDYGYGLANIMAQFGSCKYLVMSVTEIEFYGFLKSFQQSEGVETLVTHSLSIDDEPTTVNDRINNKLHTFKYNFCCEPDQYYFFRDQVHILPNTLKCVRLHLYDHFSEDTETKIVKVE